MDLSNSPPHSPFQEANLTPPQTQLGQFVTKYEQLMVNNWKFANLIVSNDPTNRLAPVRASLIGATILNVVDFGGGGGLVPVANNPGFQGLLASCYPYANILTKDAIRSTTTNGYNFQLGKTDVTRDPGVEGKGPVASPDSIFAGHWFCQYYDSNSRKNLPL